MNEMLQTIILEGFASSSTAEVTVTKEIQEIVTVLLQATGSMARNESGHQSGRR
jgi:hypothetical protein